MARKKVSTKNDVVVVTPEVRESKPREVPADAKDKPVPAKPTPVVSTAPKSNVLLLTLTVGSQPQAALGITKPGCEHT